MIRVAMLAEHSDDDQEIDGGVRAVTKYLLDALVASKELDIHVLTFKYGAENVHSYESQHYTRHIIPAANLGAFSLYAKDRLEVNRCLQRIQPDVVHSQGAGHYGLVALRTEYPTVITIHGIMSEEAKHIDNLRLRFRRRLVSFLSDRFCIAKTAHTIVISPYVAAYYGERLSGEQYNIPNPISDAFFELQREEDPARILYAGRLLPLKGVHDLIRAVAIASAPSGRIELVLAGSVSNKPYLKKLKKLAVQLGIQGNVQFRGILNEIDLLGEYRRSSILVLPSYQETAPMVIQEAMASGLPVIATDVGGISHQIDDGKTGFIVQPGNVANLASRINALLSSSTMRREFGHASRIKARNEYRASSIARKTIDVYEHLLTT